jgi:hypothetical protein
MVARLSGWLWLIVGIVEGFVLGSIVLWVGRRTR